MAAGDAALGPPRKENCVLDRRSFAIGEGSKMTDATGLEFHHVGVACIDIRAEADRMASLGYRPDGVEFSDVRQGVRGLFLGGQSPRLELLQPLDGSAAGVLTPWLKSDVKMYHIGYKTRALIG